MSQETSVAMKHEKKRPKTSKKPEECVEDPVEKDLRKKKTKKAAKRDCYVGVAIEKLTFVPDCWAIAEYMGGSFVVFPT